LLGGRLTKRAQAAHLSIVVLPFANLSGDPSQDYFADGVTENLTTELSRIRDCFVIASRKGRNGGRGGHVSMPHTPDLAARLKLAPTGRPAPGS
jgi:TolB-like protein